MKNFFKTLLIFVAAILPCAMMVAMTVALPPQYSSTFLGELADKYERQTTLEGAKITVVGGSSVAFGLDSATLQEELGMPAVDFGLYASLGTKVMLDLSLGGIGEGDIIVIAPELDPQTLSMYFNAESMWQALDEDISMLRDVKSEDLSDLAGGYFDYVSAKGKLYVTNSAPDPEGVYNRDSFNEYGDINYPRPHNVMRLGYDPNKQIDLVPEIYDEEFVTYLNEYIALAEEKGATVYYTFPPMNKTAISADTTEESILAFYDYVCTNIDCEVISNINDYIMDENYFYDSNFHLNDAGVAVRTSLLVQDILRAQGNSRRYDVSLPEPPERPTVTPGADTEDVWAEYFLYEPMLSADGKMLGYTVVGATEAARSFVKLEIPRYYNGMEVLSINENALDGCTALSDLTIRDNIISIKTGAFAGAPSLARIHIYNEDEMSMSVDQNYLFDGAASGIRICLYSRKSFDSYASGYYWTNYSEMMDLIEQ